MEKKKNKEKWDAFSYFMTIVEEAAKTGKTSMQIMVLIQG